MAFNYTKIHIYIKLKIMQNKSSSLVKILKEDVNKKKSISFKGKEYNNARLEDYINFVKNKRMVTIKYNGKREEGGPGYRRIAPVAVGEGNPPLNGIYIRAYLISGKSISNTKTGKSFRYKPGWRLFKMSRIASQAVTNDIFVIPDNEKNKFNDDGDNQLGKIYAISNFKEEEGNEKLNEHLKNMVKDILNK